MRNAWEAFKASQDGRSPVNIDAPLVVVEAAIEAAIERGDMDCVVSLPPGTREAQAKALETYLRGLGYEFARLAVSGLLTPRVCVAWSRAPLVDRNSIPLEDLPGSTRKP